MSLTARWGAVAIRADDVDLTRDRVLVEQFQSGDAAAFEREAGMAEAAREAIGLALELKNATAALAGLNKELTGTKGAFEAALANAVSAVRSLGETLDVETDRLKLALQRVQAEATGLSDASEKSRTAVSAFGSSMVALSSSSREARELLDALGKLIESVERYVRPDR